MSSTNTAPTVSVIKRRTSIRQKKTFANFVANGGNMKQAMKDAGFSPAYAKNSQKLIRSDSFRDLLELIPDRDLLDQTKAIALGEDKRASLVAIDMLFKLKDRYPAGKLKVQEYQDEIEAIQSSTETITTPNPNLITDGSDIRE